jgi:prepilin-type N-terminal cleavage/methylation domain-containing protein
MISGKSVLNSKGITLVELVIVLAIITIVTAVAAVGSGFIGTERIKSTSRELLADLQYLRQSAMTQGPDNTATALRGFGIRFESANSYHLFRFNDGNSNFMYDDTSEEAALPGESAPRTKYIPVQLKLRIKVGNRLEDPRDKVMIFDHHGIPREKQMGFQLMSIVIEDPNLLDAPRKCVSTSFTRIREGVWDEQDCLEQ